MNELTVSQIVNNLLCVNLLNITDVELAKLIRKTVVGYEGEQMGIRHAYIIACLLKELHKSLL
jgi:hypothetical protein